MRLCASSLASTAVKVVMTVAEAGEKAAVALLPPLLRLVGRRQR
jgi:hypothetical protein